MLIIPALSSLLAFFFSVGGASTAVQFSSSVSVPYIYNSSYPFDCCSRYVDNRTTPFTCTYDVQRYGLVKTNTSNIPIGELTILGNRSGLLGNANQYQTNYYRGSGSGYVCSLSPFFKTYVKRKVMLIFRFDTYDQLVDYAKNSTKEYEQTCRSGYRSCVDNTLAAQAELLEVNTEEFSLAYDVKIPGRMTFGAGMQAYYQSENMGIILSLNSAFIGAVSAPLKQAAISIRAYFQGMQNIQFTFWQSTLLIQANIFLMFPR